MDRLWTTPGVVRADVWQGDADEAARTWDAIGWQETHPETVLVARFVAARRYLKHRRRDGRDGETMAAEVVLASRERLAAALKRLGFTRLDCGHEVGEAYVLVRPGVYEERCYVCDGSADPIGRMFP